MKCEQIECPICFDVINGDKNKVTTECGHQFHARCLMQNVAHNGFDCPCCRTEMAKEPHNDEDDDETFVNDSDEDSDEDSYGETGDESTENVDDDDDESIEDVVTEYQYNNSQEHDTLAIPTVDYITSKLVEDGVTIRVLVESIMYHHPEYENDEDFDDVSRYIWGKMRNIISHFMKNQERAPVVEVVPPVVAADVFDYVIEYKYYIENITSTDFSSFLTYGEEDEDEDEDEDEYMKNLMNEVVDFVLEDNNMICV